MNKVLTVLTFGNVLIEEYKTNETFFQLLNAEKISTSRPSAV